MPVARCNLIVCIRGDVPVHAGELRDTIGNAVCCMAVSAAADQNRADRSDYSRYSRANERYAISSIFAGNRPNCGMKDTRCENCLLSLRAALLKFA